MPRPKKHRKVCCLPERNVFGPVPARIAKGEPVFLTVAEYETIRLIDYENLSQEECAESMNVARTTVQRMYEKARKNIADCVVNGKLLRIEGGNYEIYSNEDRVSMQGCCPKHKIKNIETECENENSNTN